MAQKLIMLEALPNEDILASAPLASLINAGYKVESVDGFFSSDNRPMSLVLLSDADLQVAAPKFNPASSEFEESASVTLSCDTTGASIYYTTDGSIPSSSSTAYSTAITVSATTTIIAVAIKNGVSSGYAMAKYTKAAAASEEQGG